MSQLEYEKPASIIVGTYIREMVELIFRGAELALVTAGFIIAGQVTGNLGILTFAQWFSVLVTLYLMVVFAGKTGSLFGLLQFKYKRSAFARYAMAFVMLALAVDIGPRIAGQFQHMIATTAAAARFKK